MVSFYRNTWENSADTVLKLIFNALAVLFWKAFSSVRKESLTITQRETFPGWRVECLQLLDGHNTPSQYTVPLCNMQKYEFKYTCIYSLLHQHMSVRFNTSAYV